MNRTYKFRAWGKNSKEFLHYYEGDQMIIGLTLKNIQNIEDIDAWELTQWTGLLDKNGKEIYEGDIVKWSLISDDFITWEDDKELEIHGDICSHYGAKFVDVRKVTPTNEKVAAQIDRKWVVGKKLGIVRFGYADVSSVDYGCEIHGWYIEPVKVKESQYANNRMSTTISEMYEKSEIIGNIYENPDLLTTLTAKD